MKLGED
jgi:hypothetical protein